MGASSLSALSLNGDANIRVYGLQGGKLTVGIRGTGSVVAEGQVDTLSADIRDAGDLMAKDLRSRSAEVRVWGVGTATVWATGKLAATPAYAGVGGTGDTLYYDSPSDLSKNLKGLGQIISKGDK